MRYICANCGYIYDPEKGDREQGIAPGTSFDDIHEAWKCPVCYVNKEQFDILD